MNFQFLKIVLRSIWRSIGRFLAIISIVIIGVGFYSGMQAASPNMNHAYCSYLKENNVYDLSVVSQNGFSDTDFDKFRDIDNVTDVTPASICDFIAEIEQNRTSIRTYSHDFANNEESVNKLDLVDGRFPENNKECVVSLESLNLEGIDIGSHIQIVDNNPVATNTFSTNTFEVVGFVHSPVCIDKTFVGNTNVGDGMLYNTMFVRNDAFDTSVPYGYVYLSCSDLDYSDQENYNCVLDQVIDSVKSTSDLANDYKILKRKDNSSLNAYEEYTQRTKSIAIPFPVLFFIVTVIIIIATMNRKVNEDRSEIGTLKAFGFSKIHITAQYAIYSLCATIIGCIIGASVLYSLIVKCILDAYNDSYVIALQEIQYYPDIIISAVSIMIFVVLLFTLLSVVSVIWKPCVELMRPIAPSKGRHVVLEKISFIWNRISYVTRVGLRNFTRHPGRLCMSILGITGCVVLVLSSVNLFVSASNMVKDQFGEIYHENAIMNVDYSQTYSQNDYETIKSIYPSLVSKEDAEKQVVNTLENLNDNLSYLGINQQSAIVDNDYSNGKVNDLYVYVQSCYSYEDLSEMRLLVNPDDGSEINLNDIRDKSDKENFSNGAIITDGMAKTLKLNIGDEITFRTIRDYGQKSNDEITVRVCAITKNYIMNYIYLDKDAYNNVFNEDFDINCYLLKTNEESQTKDYIQSKLFDNKYVSYLKFYDKEYESYEEVIKSTYMISVVMCIVAAILVFIVIFCITEINVSERKQEIAVLKVLGLPGIITDTYVHRETLFQFLISVVLGFAVGTVFSQVVLDSVKGSTMSFDTNIDFWVYVIVFVYSLIIVLLSILIMTRKTRKLNLVENLKSID